MGQPVLHIWIICQKSYLHHSSVSTSAHQEAWEPEDPKDGRKEAAPENCPPIFLCAPHPHAQSRQ